VQDRETNILPQIESSLSLRLALTQLCTEFSDIFGAKVEPEPALINPMQQEVNPGLWFTPANRNPARPVSQPKRDEIKRQVELLLKLNVIRPSQAPAWSQVHLVPKPDRKKEKKRNLSKKRKRHTKNNTLVKHWYHY
jgi:hypothetical protein